MLATQTGGGYRIPWCRAALAWGLAGGLIGCLGACSPPLNWRQVAVPDSQGLGAMYPCRPAHHVRVVPWPDVPGGVQVQLLTCEAGGATWALQYVQLPDVALVPAGMKEWRMVMERNLSPARSQDLGAVKVPGMTPSEHAHAWRFDGRRPERVGPSTAAVSVRAWHFSHGATVFQASVWRAAGHPAVKTDEDVAQEFFQGFQFLQ